MNKHSMNMTSGPILQQLLIFSLPTLAGELFQQLYNTVDSAVAGAYISPQALAAVGGTGNITKLLINFFMGISLGYTILISRQFGSEETEKLKRSIHVIMNMSFILGFLLSGTGVFLTPLILRLLAFPEDIFHPASLYLRIYFGGLPALVLYNTATGILRAVGDSRHPLLFLVSSSALNIALDFLFVVRFHWGVAGIAAATLVSQLLAACACLFLLLTTRDACRWYLSGPLLDREVVAEVLHHGLPIAVQKTLTQFSNMIVLRFIAHFGSACLAGWAVFSKLYSFAITTTNSLGTSVTAFVGQNAGAGNRRRVRQGIRDALLLSFLAVGLLMAGILFFARPLIRIFGDAPEPARYALLFLHWVFPFLFLLAVQSVLAGGLRGLGLSMESTVAIFMGTVVIRQAYLWIVTRFLNTLPAISLSFPVAWLFCIGILLYYLLSAWKPQSEK